MGNCVRLMLCGCVLGLCICVSNLCVNGRLFIRLLMGGGNSEFVGKRFCVVVCYNVSGV